MIGRECLKCPQVELPSHLFTWDGQCLPCKKLRFYFHGRAFNNTSVIRVHHRLAQQAFLSKHRKDATLYAFQDVLGGSWFWIFCHVLFAKMVVLFFGLPWATSSGKKPELLNTCQ